MGRCPYHPRMMLKVIIYAYMNNIYSCRRIEQLLLRDIHFIWLSGYEKPDFITINRFRNRLKDEINNIFTQLVLVLAEKGFVSLDVEYVDGTKIESKANKYTFVWRKTVERNRARLIDKVKALLRILELFGLHEVGMFALCTAGTLAVFAAVYALVYGLTARTYERIVGGEA